MINSKALPDLIQLKKWGVMDTESYREILLALEKNQKILTIASKNSGKNTVQHAVVNYLHRLYKESLVIPSIEGVPSKKF